MKSGRLRSSSFDRSRQQTQRRKIRVGICARDKKTHSKPMTQILQRFDKNIFDVVIFGDDTILNQPIEKWPPVDCLMSWYSAGFPLERAQAYVKLRDPFSVNNLSAEHVIRDRRKFYSVLEQHGIPTPHHVIVSRDGPPGSHTRVLETEDAIEVDGVRINKPFVEKPVDAEDHNIYIYYPRRLGGGSKRLFRKVGNVSSRFYAEEHNIRAEGSFIYEEFIMTQGTDIKIYTVGPDYAHAEARKSPVVDGIVQRDEEGKEVRFPIMLTNKEKDMVRRVCLAFGQNVCGFDLLRTPGKSYVCDVNGWSFVKKSHKYYDDAAQLLMLMMLRAVAPERLHTNVLLHTSPPAGLAGHTRYDGLHRSGFFATGGGTSSMQRSPSTDTLCVTPTLPQTKDGSPPATSALGQGGVSTPGGGYLASSPGADSESGEGEEELRCVAAIIRHGDRTPKQKMKMRVTASDFLDMHKKYAKNPREEGKLKSAAQLQHVLEVTRKMIAARLGSTQGGGGGAGAQGWGGADGARGGVPPSSPPRPGVPRPSSGGDHAGEEPEHDHEDLDKLLQMKEVLEKGGHFSGINRKVQLKPTKWRTQENRAADVGSATIRGAAGAPPPSLSLASVVSGDLAVVPPPSLPGASRTSKLPVPASASGVTSASEGDAALPFAAMTSADPAGAGGHPSLASSGNPGGDASSSEADVSEEVTECLLVLKWGGVLTHAGVEQSESLGQRFRSVMYPGESVGLLRLHSTYRHDLKIYSSDEGRVQMTAAAFVKGFLDLEGELTPILASLVKTVNTSNLLDDSDPARDVMTSLKKRLKKALTSSINAMGRLAGSGTDSEAEPRGLRPAPFGSLTRQYQKGQWQRRQLERSGSVKSKGSGGDCGAEADWEGPSSPCLDSATAPASPSMQSVLLLSAAAAGQGHPSTPEASMDEEGRSGEGQGEGAGEDAGEGEGEGGTRSGTRGGEEATDAAEYRLSSMETLDLPSSAELKAIEVELSSALVQAIAPTRTAALLRALKVIGPNPLRTLHRVYELISALTEQLAALQRLYTGEGRQGGAVPAVAAIIGSVPHAPPTGGGGSSSTPTPAPLHPHPEGPDALLCGGESLWLMLERWRKLRDDFYTAKKDKYDLSKIPDIYDCIKYDAVHNAALGLEGVKDLYTLVKAFADLVVSQEYGIDVDEKADIAARIAHHLLRKVFFDMTAITVEDTLEIQAAQAARSRTQALSQGKAKKEDKAAKEVSTDSPARSTTSVAKEAGQGGTSRPADALPPAPSPAAAPLELRAASAVGSAGVGSPLGPLPHRPVTTETTAAPPRSPMLFPGTPRHYPSVTFGQGPTPVPLGTSVSSSKALESSAVVGLVVSIKQHPSYAYTKGVRRKSAPSILLPGMHKSAGPGMEETSFLGRAEAEAADSASPGLSKDGNRGTAASPGDRLCGSDEDPGPLAPRPLPVSSWAALIRPGRAPTTEAVRGAALLAKRGGAGRSVRAPLSAMQSSVPNSLDTSMVDVESDGTSVITAAPNTLQSPGGTVRDTVAKGTVLVPGMRLRQRAAAARADKDAGGEAGRGGETGDLSDAGTTSGAGECFDVQPPSAGSGGGAAQQEGAREDKLEGYTRISPVLHNEEETVLSSSVNSTGRIAASPLSWSASPSPAVHFSKVMMGLAGAGQVQGATAPEGHPPPVTVDSQTSSAPAQPATGGSIQKAGSVTSTASVAPSPGSLKPDATVPDDSLPASAMDLLAADMHDIAETVHQLDARVVDDAGYGSVKTPQRHVRTRLYFTSESHVHALVNTLKYWALRNGRPHRDSAANALPHTSGDGGAAPRKQSDEGGGGEDARGSRGDDGGEGGEGAPPRGGEDGRTEANGVKRLLSDEGRALLDATPELDYLTHIVFRQYENFSFPYGHPKRHRVEILFSPGTAFSPFDGMPRTPRVAAKPSPPLGEVQAERVPSLSLGGLGLRAASSDDLPRLHVPGRRETGDSTPVFDIAPGCASADDEIQRTTSGSKLSASRTGEGGEERDDGPTPVPSLLGGPDRARFLSTAVKPPAAFTGPAHATRAELLSHTLPVAPAAPLVLSLSLDDFEDIMAEAIYSGANLGRDTGGGAAGGGDGEGMPAVGQGWQAASRAAGASAGALARGGGVSGSGTPLSPGGTPIPAVREQHPKEEVKARVAQAAARWRRHMGDGYFLY